MSIDVGVILWLALGGLAYSALVPPAGRRWVLLGFSLFAVYFFQPPIFVRYVDFILPTAAILLTTVIWWATRHPDEPATPARSDWQAGALILAVIAGIVASRYLAMPITPSRPPEPFPVAIGLLVSGALLWLGSQAFRQPRQRILALTALLIMVFIILKTDALATLAGAMARTLTSQDTSQASPLDWRWIGFSYIAFRLLHALRDRATGLLPRIGLGDFVTYALFFPALPAGPIDRVERWQKDMDALPLMQGLDPQRLGMGATRILIGLFKKFAIADWLALFALNEVNATQAESGLALWFLLYAYAFRLYFDFSGYTDIAIGLGMLYGIRLPENFNQPYLKTSLTAFWQSWHITLSNWARFYVFSPLSRALLQRRRKPPTVLIPLIAHLATMIVIGLWHGVTGPFFVWGVWHGLGLYAHKRWSDHTRAWYRGLGGQGWRARLWALVGILLTFHFVVLGWVWFALPDLDIAVSVFLRLFGIVA